MLVLVAVILMLMGSSIPVAAQEQQENTCLDFDPKRPPPNGKTEYSVGVVAFPQLGFYFYTRWNPI